MKRFNRTARHTDRRPVCKCADTLKITPPMETAGANDAKHFPRADVVNLEVNRAELDTIAAALVYVGQPETLSLLRRFRCR
jgi:hypothetical protein